MAKRKENKEALYRELKRLSKATNQRILEIEKRYGKDSWAIGNLRNRLQNPKLNAWTKTGRVSVRRDYSTLQMKAIIKANEQFIKSKTSSTKGIANIKKDVVKSLRETLSDETVQLSDKEAENLYKILEDKANRGIVDKLGGSDIFAIVSDTIRADGSKETFERKIKQVLIYSQEDKDTVNQLNNIYDKYIKGR